MIIRDFMTPEPWTISPERSIKDAKEMMLIHKVRRLPVAKGGTLVGIITKEDILAASPSVLDFMNAEEIKAHIEGTMVQSIMTEDPYTVDADAPIEKAALIMKEKKIGGIPVLEKGKLIGMITETDIFRTFVQYLGIKEDTLRHAFNFTNISSCMEKVQGIIDEEGSTLASLLIFHRRDGTQRVILRTQNAESPG
ncbi:MAG: CBS domain-containing protein [Planctomycetota bacterium]|jgi:acetoin utilization protein AcuB